MELKRWEQKLRANLARSFYAPKKGLRTAAKWSGSAHVRRFAANLRLPRLKGI